MTLAAIYGLTGMAAATDGSAIEGVRLAVDEANANGGVLGRPVQMLLLDHHSTPLGAHTAAQEAIKAKAVGIIGSNWSTPSIAIGKVAQQNKTPMIATIATHPEVTRSGDYVFRICFNDELQGRALAMFARQDLNVQSAGILVDVASDYSMNLSEIFHAHFERLGGRVLAKIHYKHSQGDFSQPVRRARALNAQLLLIAGHDESGLIALQLQEAGEKAFLIGGDGWSMDSFAVKGGRFLDRGYYMTHWFPGVQSAPSQKFMRHYGIAYIADSAMVLAYDATKLMVDAILRAGSLKGAQIRAALAATQGFEGVTGNISFDDNGDPHKNVVIMKIDHGTRKYLKTWHHGLDLKNRTPRPVQKRPDASEPLPAVSPSTPDIHR